MQPKPPNNDPSLWRDKVPVPLPEGNKYDRGYAVITGGWLLSTGATKLAAVAALRIGAGLVSVACDSESLPVYANCFQAVMNKLVRSAKEFSALIEDAKVTAVLIGCGGGITQKTKDFALAALNLHKQTVLDADAITVFKDNPNELFSAIKSSKKPCILTPHEGEFARIFSIALPLSSYTSSAVGSCDYTHTSPSLPVAEKKLKHYIDGDRLERAKKSAEISGAVVVLKGFNTIIAAPDGRVVINNNASPYLATAGSGDVLAGMCVGLLAGNMPAFEAACAAVWLHGEAGSKLGVGLIAEDIAKVLPEILREVYMV